MNSGRSFAAWLGLATVLCGCDLGPDYRRPALDIPSGFRAPPASAQIVWPSIAWWRGFRSPELDQLIVEAEAYNFDIAAAVARIREADAAVRIAGAPLLPSLTGSGSASWSEQGFNGSTTRTGGLTRTISGGTADFHSYSGGLTVAYEADFWGRNLSTRRAAVASAVFSRFDSETVALTTITNVATTWFNALAFADQLAIARENLADSEQTLAAIRGRLEAGTASALDLAQQETLVDGVRASIPALRNELEHELIGLGILIGRPPEQVTARPGTLIALALPPVQPGLPSALLRRRPDVAAAEAQLVAQNFDIKAARAAFFPTLTLTGDRGYQNNALADLFTPGGLFAAVTASLAQPILDGGALRGQLEQAKGRYAELLADYRKSVVQAFTDVDNALTAWRFTSEQEALQQQAVDAAGRAEAAAKAELAAGTIDVTTLLTTEATLYSDENTLVQVRLSRFIALLDLYIALGGGWQEPDVPIRDEFPGLSPGLLPGSVALPVGGDVWSNPR